MEAVRRVADQRQEYHKGWLAIWGSRDAHAAPLVQTAGGAGRAGLSWKWASNGEGERGCVASNASRKSCGCDAIVRSPLIASIVIQSRPTSKVGYPNSESGKGCRVIHFSFL
jgi:hypothetical protein